MYVNVLFSILLHLDIIWYIIQLYKLEFTHEGFLMFASWDWHCQADLTEDPEVGQPKKSPGLCC